MEIINCTDCMFYSEAKGRYQGIDFTICVCTKWRSQISDGSGFCNYAINPEKIEPTPLAKRLKTFREVNNFSIAKVAKFSGVSPSTISRIEGGYNRKTRPDIVEKLDRLIAQYERSEK